MEGVALIVAGLLTIPIGMAWLKVDHQRSLDKDRSAYDIIFPATLDTDRVMAWLRAISGTLQTRPGKLSGTHSIVFEAWATDRGIRHVIKVPRYHADYIIGQLRSLVPGIRVTPQDEPLERTWTVAVEVGMSRPSRTLRIESPGDLASSLLTSLTPLAAGETMVVQWVVSPAFPRKPPLRNGQSDDFSWFTPITGSRSANKDEVDDRRSKLSEANVMAVLRVGAVASDERKARDLIYRVRSAFASVRSPFTSFIVRSSNASKVGKRITSGAGVLINPVQLSISELTPLIAWPIGSQFISGLPQGMAPHLPASEAILRDGIRIGRSNWPGNERPIAIGHVDALQHTHIVGPTGVGKTTLMANMVAQTMEQGYGLVLIESKGDLFRDALDYVPSHRLHDVIVVDVNDAAMPVGFNILREGKPRTVVDDISALFEHLYRDNRNVWTRQMMYHGLHTLQSRPGTTFIDLAPLLSPMTREEVAWRDDLIRGLSDPELKNFWQLLDNMTRTERDRHAQPVMDRIWQLNARPEIRNIIGQSESSFSMRDVVTQNKILLVNLSGVGQETASLAGTLLMNALWGAVKDHRAEKPTYLYLDEFQDFLNLPVGAEDMLAKSRSFGLGLILAHQHLGQLPPDIKGAVLANARSKIVFQTTADDARVMSREFGNVVDEHSFMHLGRYEAVARIATGDGVSAPITLATLAPFERDGRAQQVRQLSRQTYGRRVGDVEAEIRSRRTVEGGSKKTRPPIGGAWDEVV